MGSREMAASHFVQHPSSDLASLGHLLPQGEKEEFRADASANFQPWRFAEAEMQRTSLLPLWEKVAERSEVG
jgi:hypothetical protein